MSMAVVAEIIGRETLESLKKPTGKARGLPGVAYTSEKMLRLENEKLFPRVWVQAGLTHELANPGDTTLATVAGRPLILVRSPGGEIKAFYNSCSHRGTQLCKRNARRRKNFICPYHTWKFDLDGRLLETPNFNGHEDGRVIGYRLENLGLHQVRCDVWYKWVFVNLDGKAPPLADYMFPFTDRLRGYDFNVLEHGGAFTFEMETNWKLIQENYNEGLHVRNIHPLLNAAEAYYEHSNVLDDTYMGTVVDAGIDLSEAPVPLPLYPDPPQRMKFEEQQAQDFATGFNNINMFPNFKFVAGPNHAASGTEYALGPGRVRQRWDVFFIGDAATKPEYEPARKEIVDFYRMTFQEDKAILEALQKGHQAGQQGGIFAETWEGTVHHFQRLVIDCLTSRKQPFTGPNRRYRKRTRHGGPTSWGRSI